MGQTTTSSTILSIGSSGFRVQGPHQPQAKARPRRFAWIDVLIALSAVAGLTASVLYKVQMRTSTFAASDFKTLYASVWCFAHGMDAYSIPNLQRVFQANGVVQPEKWYGHAPVYPSFTLAFLSPIAAVGMVAAAYLLTILSALLLAMSVVALMRYAARNFDLGLGWRIGIAGLCACGPLLSFGMDMGNISLAVCAFCFLAFAWRSSGFPGSRGGSPWIPGAALAMAFLLKPHLGVWTGMGMLLLPERAARAVVVRAVALAAGFAAVSAAVMAAMGTLGLETHSYLAMLSAETATGASMNATSREVLPVVAQITSLESIVGFWIASPALRLGVTYAALLGLALLLLQLTRRADTERGALLAVGAWCTLGMLASYHRAHDAAMLLMVVPWVVDRARRAPLELHAWAAAALYCVMSVSADLPVVERWVSSASAHSLEAFVLLRQVGLADLLLLLVLLVALRRECARNFASRAGSTEADEMLIAA